MTKYFRNCFCPILFLIVMAISYSSVLAAPPLNTIPIPQETLVVAWVRPALVASDPQLKSLTSDLGIVYQNLQRLGLSNSSVDEAVMFAPFDLRWFAGSGRGFPQNLPSSGALIIKGKFNADTKYRDLKSKGWKENHFDQKKVLFWSVGETFLCSLDGGICMAALKGDRLVVGGSSDIVKDVLNVAEGKIPGMDNDQFYQQIDKGFSGNSNTAISVFAIVTNQMRALIKPPPAPDDSTSASAKAAVTAINTIRSYSSHIKELGLNMAASAGGYQVVGSLVFDSENSAALVSTVFQFGGGLINFLPQNDPARAIIAGLQVSRDGAILNLTSNLSRQQFNDVFIKRK